MLPKIFLLTLTCFLPLVGACSAAPSPPGGARTERFCYASSDDQRVRSTLERTEEGGGEHLVGVTELDGGEGGRLRQDVTLDATGALKHAEARLDGLGGRPAKHVRMDPLSGSVDITTPSFHVHWDVPTDLPWIWAPLLTVNALGGPIITPLDARVVWRAAAKGRSVRLLDLGVLANAAVTADQIAVADAHGGTVILADDSVDIEGGMPERLHLAALGVEVQAMGTSGTLVALAKCISANGIAAR
jgi:hypothetical protein